MSLVAVARLVGVFGIAGELRCRVTPAGSSALTVGAQYALSSAPDSPRVTCAGIRGHRDRLIVALEGVTTPEAARAYVGRELFAERESIALPPDEYLDSDLIGLQLIDEQGRALGDVVGVEHFPAQDYLVVGAQRALVPLVHAFIRKIDAEARTIVVDLPEGLL